jgi:hypothetical protein
MPSMEGKQVAVRVQLEFDPTVEDSKDAGAYPLKWDLPDWLLDYKLAAGARTRMVESDLAATTGGLSDDLSGLTALDAVIIHNPIENANYVDTTFRSAANGANDNIVRVYPGKTVVLPDVTKTTALTHTANTATTTIMRWYIGY